MNNTIQSKLDQIFQEGRYEEAIAFCNKSIQEEPGVVANYWYLGLAHLLCNDSEMADSIWMSILVQATAEEIETWTVELIHILAVEANRCMSAEQYGIARTLYEKILEVQPSLLDGHIGLGIACLLQQDLEEAIAVFEQAIALDPRSAVACYHLGHSYKNKGNLEEAIQKLYDAIQLDPDFAEAYSLIGVCFREKKALDKAIQFLEKAIDLNPNLAKAYFSLGTCLYEKYTIDASIPIEIAISHMCQAIALGFDCAQAYQSLGGCFQEKGEFDRALQQFKKAIERQPNLIVAHIEKARCLRSLGRISTAIESLQMSLKLCPESEELRRFIDQLLECDRTGYFPLLHEGKVVWDAMLFRGRDRYHLFYLTGDSTARPFWSVGNLAAATSSDLQTWKYLGVLLPTKTDSTWENGRMLAGSMYQEEGQYYFFYSAAPADEIMNEHIGLATSIDGFHWRRRFEPLIEPDPHFYCSTPTVFRGQEIPHRAWRDPYIFKESEAGRYYLFISACCPGKNPHYQGCIGLAVADNIDGPYEVLPPVVYPVDDRTGEGIYYELERPQVIYHNGKYHLFFSTAPERIHPQWLERAGKEIASSSLHWYVSETITGPYRPGAEKPVVKGSDRTYLYGTNFIEAPDGQFYAYGARYTTQTLEVSPRFPLRWVDDVPEIMVDFDGESEI